MEQKNLRTFAKIKNDIDMEKEEWKQVSTIGIVKDTKGKEVDFTPYTNYWVSTMGRVYNETTKRFLPKEGKGIDKDGYIRVSLTNAKNKNIRIATHILVGYTFLENPNGYQQINHKSEDKSDNSVFNLEYCTCKDNINYGTRNKRVAEKLSKEVFQYDLNDNLLKIWNSSMDAERSGFIHSCIYECCKGRQKKHKGYKWRYAPIIKRYSFFGGALSLKKVG